MIDTYVPLALSLVALVVWPLAFGGIIVHWRSRRTLPTGVIAAFMVAISGSVLRGLIGSTVYAQPELILSSEAALAAHVERAMLVLTGLWALVLLVRSRRRW